VAFTVKEAAVFAVAGPLSTPADESDIPAGNAPAEIVKA
jgi:hypothetical protein